MAASTAGLDARTLGLIAFALALATILGALGSEVIGGLVPCELCYTQRLPYYVGLPVLALLLVFWGAIPRAGRVLVACALAAVFAWGAYLGVYHAGVEYGVFPGPTSCTGIGTGSSFEQLNNLDAVRVIPCDKVQFAMFGVSLAGFNAIISLALVATMALIAIGEARKTQL